MLTCPACPSNAVFCYHAASHDTEGKQSTCKALQMLRVERYQPCCCKIGRMGCAAGSHETVSASAVWRCADASVRGPPAGLLQLRGAHCAHPGRHAWAPGRCPSAAGLWGGPQHAGVHNTLNGLQVGSHVIIGDLYLSCENIPVLCCCREETKIVPTQSVYHQTVHTCRIRRAPPRCSRRSRTATTPSCPCSGAAAQSESLPLFASVIAEQSISSLLAATL